MRAKSQPQGKGGRRPCAPGATGVSHVLVPECQLSGILRIANSEQDSRAWGQSPALAGAVTPLGEPQAPFWGHNGRHSLDGLPYERRGRASATHL